MSTRKPIEPFHTPNQIEHNRSSAVLQVHFPLMLASRAFRLPGAMGIAGAICVVGLALTFLLQEPARKSLETIEKEGEKIDAVTGQPDSSETTELWGKNRSLGKGVPLRSGYKGKRDTFNVAFLQEGSATRSGRLLDELTNSLSEKLRLVKRNER